MNLYNCPTCLCALPTGESVCVCSIAPLMADLEAAHAMLIRLRMDHRLSIPFDDWNSLLDAEDALCRAVKSERKRLAATAQTAPDVTPQESA